MDNDAVVPWLLVHEARHIDEGINRHVVCNQGKYKGTRDCDERFYEKWDQGSGYSFGVKHLSTLIHSALNYNSLSRS